MDTYRTIKFLFVFQSLDKHFSTNRLGMTDKAWNILAINPLLHRWWEYRL